MITYNSLSDLELVSLLNNSDKDAYTAIYKRYWAKIFAIASKRLGNEEEAEEIVQEIFLNLWRKHETFVLTTGFNNYFAIAVKFEILDILRKRNSISNYDKELGFSYDENDYSTLRHMDMLELQKKLQLTITQLPEKCQLVFRLKYEQGYSQKQIAEELNLSEKTVEAHLSKARKILRGNFGHILGAILFIFF